MTNIQALKLARDEAQERVNAAQKALVEAEKRLVATQIEASGLMGKIVEKGRLFRMVVQFVGINGTGDPIVVRGKVLNRDGSASHENGEVWLCTPHKVCEFINEMEGA